MRLHLDIELLSVLFGFLSLRAQLNRSKPTERKKELQNTMSALVFKFSTVGNSSIDCLGADKWTQMNRTFLSPNLKAPSTATEFFPR